MFRFLTAEETRELARNDALLQQIVKNAKLMYDGSKVYLMRQDTDGLYRSVSVTGVTWDQCDQLGRMFDPHYSDEGSSEDFEQYFGIAPYDSYLDKNSVDISDIG